MIYNVSFQYSENVFCTNMAIAESVETVAKHYSKYAWVNITEATAAELETAKKKGMPIRIIVK